MDKIIEILGQQSNSTVDGVPTKTTLKISPIGEIELVRISLRDGTILESIALDAVEAIDLHDALRKFQDGGYES